MSKFRLKKKSQAGFTLIEMLIVIAIIAGLAALVLPMIGGVKEKAAHATDASNQADLTKQIFTFADLNGDYPDIADSLLGAAVDGDGNLTGLSDNEVYKKLYVTVGSMGPKRGIAYPFELNETNTAEGGYEGWDTDYPDKTVGIIMLHGLGKLGINNVVDHDEYKLADGRYRVEYPNDSTTDAIVRDLGPGMPSAPADFIAILNTVAPWPFTSTDPKDLASGYVKNIYDHFGLQLPVNAAGELTGNAVDGDIVVLFGFGNRNTMVGSTNGGVHDAPFSSAFDANSYYSRYIAMFVVPKTMGARAKFLGVLGANGYPVWKSHQKFASAE